MNEIRTPRFIQSPVADAGPEAARLAPCSRRGRASRRNTSTTPSARVCSRRSPSWRSTTRPAPRRRSSPRRGAELRAAIGSGTILVDLGAGNCAKAESLFPVLQPKRYVAVDVSVEFLRSALARAARASRARRGRPRPGFLAPASSCRPSCSRAAPPLFFYPGSSIGNFSRDEAFAFLRRIHARAGGGGLLIGVDLVKPRPVLEAAYDDALGVTAAFNLNALRHLNAAIGSDFEPRQWRHVAFYDEAEARIEMHLEARAAARRLAGPGGERRFAAGERIHTENSYKYTARRLRLAAARRRLSPAAGPGPTRRAGSPSITPRPEP